MGVHGRLDETFRSDWAIILLLCLASAQEANKRIGSVAVLIRQIGMAGSQYGSRLGRNHSI
jgi:hypothetical protein